MPALTTDTISIARDELLMLFWHADSREWWATVSPDDDDNIRALGTGDTPVAALAALLIDLDSGTVSQHDA